MSSDLVKKGKKVASSTAARVVQDLVRERDQVVRKNNSPIRKKDDPVEWIVRLAAAGIGFISEAYHYRQERKSSRSETQAQSPTQSETPLQTPNNTVHSQQFNEAVWELDDAATEPPPLEKKSEPPKEALDLAKAFIKRHPNDSMVDPTTKLRLPVVINQRRPKTRARGFVRAYSPVLADVGIDQETFLDFIDSFNKALEPNPYLYALNLAEFASLAVPEPMMMLLGVAVGIATEAIMEVQSRFKSNKFLDAVNVDFFIPRGLICLVVTWKPDAPHGELITAVDFEGRAVQDRSKSSMSQKIKDVITKKISGEEDTKGTMAQLQGLMKSHSSELEWKEPAPLIFQSPDENRAVQLVDSKGKKKKAIDRAEIWLDEYMDRRAQARWMETNSDLPMVDLPPKPEFRSRYADPNHPASSGDLVALLTGGKWASGPDKQVKGIAPNINRDGEDCGQDAETSKTKSLSSKNKSDMGGGIMSFFQSDILYLLIVNLPSPEQIATVSP